MGLAQVMMLFIYIVKASEKVQGSSSWKHLKPSILGLFHLENSQLKLNHMGIFQ